MVGYLQKVKGAQGLVYMEQRAVWPFATVRSSDYFLDDSVGASHEWP